MTTGPDGAFFVPLPAGSYLLEPQPVEGYMGTAPPLEVSVKDGIAAEVQVDYDTGIR